MTTIVRIGSGARSGSRSRAGSDSRATATAGADVTPLSQRAAVMMLFRAASATVLAAIATLASVPAPVSPWLVAAVYVLVSGALSLGVLLPVRSVGLRLFGTSLLLDGVVLQYQHEVLGHRLGVDVALAADLVAVCLLASFRTGLKIALWQSLLLLVAVRGEASGLFAEPAAFAGADRDQLLLSDLALLWLVVVTTAVATSVNERELRRRRYDAEALADLATRLGGDEDPDGALARLVDFVAAELDAPRSLVCRRTPDGLTLLAARGTAVPAAGIPGDAALFDLAAGRDDPTLVLRLDAARDPWLDALLPQARRLVALRVGGPDAYADSTWLVVEHGRRGGARAERRVLSSLQQAVATAALAWSRADLLAQARRAASTDGLTGVANRRTFDTELARLTAACQGHGAPFALVLVDVDHFKSVNDRLGHQAGDEVLQTVARTLARVGRPGDVTARYGGEEFAILLPGADVPQAVAVAEQARLALRDIADPVPVSASFGVAAMAADGGELAGAAALVEAADMALIHAKRTGRDRVVEAGPHVPAVH